MAQAIVCDGCGTTVDYMVTVHIQSHNIEDGSIQIDLCPDCALPVKALPAYQAEKERIAKEMVDREVEAAQRIAESRIAEVGG